MNREASSGCQHSHCSVKQGIRRFLRCNYRQLWTSFPNFQSLTIKEVYRWTFYISVFPRHGHHWSGDLKIVHPRVGWNIAFLQLVPKSPKICSCIFTIIITSDLGRDHHHHHCRQHHDRDGVGPIITTTTIIIFITTTTIIIITTTIITNMMIITVSSIMTGKGWDP